MALQKINHTKLVNQDGETRNFTEEERRALTLLLFTQKEVKYAAVRKKLGLPEDILFYNLNYKKLPRKKNSKKKIKIRKKQNLLGCHTTMITRNVWKNG